jgi:ferredoxin
MAIANGEPKVAVVRCNGTCEHRPKIVEYAGLRTCAAMHACGAGETACGYGCLGCGDCVEACQFDAIHINPETGIVEVDEERCVACGACVKTCPRGIIELRKKGPKGRRVYVSCINKDKGAVSMKACKVCCIGCGKCAKECPFDAITIGNNCSYIDPAKCRLCRKCVVVCPTHAIVAVNFPVPKPKPENPENPENPESPENPAKTAKTDNNQGKEVTA